jgi:predicted dehydrogenase
MAKTRYYLRLPEPAQARGDDPALAFHSTSAEGFAAEFQDALRTSSLFARWQATLEDPDDADGALAAIDPDAVVTGRQSDLHVDLVATTSLPGAVFKHRLRLLAGSHWQLRDVTAG